MESKVDIILAAYNGEKYIAEQIESIIKQSFKNWRLLIRDDNSTDRTLNIIKKYSQLDNRIRIVENNNSNKGVTKNFEILLNISKAEYTAFSDQDDVWLPCKIEKMMKEIQQTEKEYGYENAVLIHTDAYIADKDLNILSENFIADYGHKEGLNKLLFASKVQGASMMINKKLKKRILPLPDGLQLYDYYISLICEIFGIRKFIDQSLMYYRIHDNNLLGRYGNKIDLLKRFLKRESYLSRETEIYAVKSFKEKYIQSLNKNEIKMIDDYLNLNNNCSLFEKIEVILKNGFEDRYGKASLLLRALIN